MNYAYARVSAIDQNLARQLNDFAAFGIDPKNIFADKKSGKNFERERYRALLKKLKKNDLIVVKSIDRLGRNYDQIIEEWNKITNTIGADILVLDMPLLDTRVKPDSLVGRFISDIVLQVLSFVAEYERANNKVRQAEGIRAAKLRGIKFGRPKKEYPPKVTEMLRKYQNRSVSLREALLTVGMSRANFYRLYRKFRKFGAL